MLPLPMFLRLLMHGTHSALPLVHARLRFHRVNTGGGVERERHSVNRGDQSQ